jgi:hypothetical protein
LEFLIKKKKHVQLQPELDEWNAYLLSLNSSNDTPKKPMPDATSKKSAVKSAAPGTDNTKLLGNTKYDTSGETPKDRALRMQDEQKRAREAADKREKEIQEQEQK